MYHVLLTLSLSFFHSMYLYIDANSTPQTPILITDSPPKKKRAAADMKSPLRNLTPSKRPKTSLAEGSENSMMELEQVFCVCRGVEGTELMIACDSCSEWSVICYIYIYIYTYIHTYIHTVFFTSLPATSFLYNISVCLIHLCMYHLSLTHLSHTNTSAHSLSLSLSLSLCVCILPWLLYIGIISVVLASLKNGPRKSKPLNVIHAKGKMHPKYRRSSLLKSNSHKPPTRPW